jgi:8-oxo-dGTP pyrophosphatase MutT (NUDIX family)
VNGEGVQRAAGVIAVAPSGRVLMCRRTDSGEWAFPAGGMEQGETPDKTALREFFEETGYRLGGVEQLMRRIKDGVDFTTFVSVVDDEFRPRLNHEHDTYEWFDPQWVVDQAKANAQPRNGFADAYADDAYADLYDPTEARDPTGRWTALGGSSGHPALISSRPIRALGVKPEERAAMAKARQTYNRVDVAALKEDPALYKRNVGLFREKRFYPGMRPDEVKGSVDDVEKAVEQRMADNLVFLAKHAMDIYGSEAKRWMGWYEGAHRLAEGYAKKYGIDVASAAGVIAALSPQNDWFTNVRQADVVMNIMANHRNDRWDAAMTKTAKRIWKGVNLKDAEAMIANPPTLQELTGKDPESRQKAAIWIRTYDETHSDRSYRKVSPEGQLGDPVTTDKGAKSRAAWKTVGAISNAIEAFESHGDATMIGDAMGAKHKVRSFYNNILDPDSPNGDITADTHAVGAAWLQPSTAADIPVIHALHSTLMRKEQPEGYKATGASSKTGVSGTYAVYADAYRDAAKQLGMQPRQLQSLVWEAKQRLFSKAATGTKIKDAIDAVWRKFNSGEIDLKTARDQVIATAAETLGAAA